MRVVIDIQNELLLKLHQLNGLSNLRAFWDFAVCLNEGANLFAACLTHFTLRDVIIDVHMLLLFAY